jgi:hypothetical protein
LYQRLPLGRINIFGRSMQTIMPRYWNRQSIRPPAAYAEFLID